MTKQNKTMQTLLSLLTYASLEDLSEQETFEVLELADVQYAEGTPVITDDQYDIIYHEAKLIYPNNKYFATANTAIQATSAGAVKLPYHMGSLIQLHDADVRRFMKHMPSGDLVISDKYDGISVLLEYIKGQFVRAYTRGDGFEGDDITHHVKRMNIPVIVGEGDEDFGVRAELIVSKANTEAFLKESAAFRPKAYSNMRNGVAGLMNRDEVIDTPNNIYQYVDVKAYEIKTHNEADDKLAQLIQLGNWGFDVAEYTTTSNQFFHGNEAALKGINEERVRNSEYELDGIVIDVNSADYRKKMGLDADLYPNYARKYKVNLDDAFVKAVIVDVEWNVSMHGYMKPTAILEPVQLAGATITRATLHNAKRVVDGKIGKGAVVSLVRSGGVIPYIADVIVPADEIALPKGIEYEWNDTKVDFVMMQMHTIDNEDIRVANSEHFFKSIGVDGIGEGNLRRLYQANIRTLEEVLSSSEEDLQQALRSLITGEQIYHNIRNQLMDGVVTIDKFAGASNRFGRGVGVRLMESLMATCTNDAEFIALLQDANKIAAIKGFSNITAQKIVRGFPEFVKLKDAFELNGGTFKQVEKVDTTSLPLDGKSFAFTEVRSKDAEAKIKELGGRVAGSVTRKTTMVIAADAGTMTSKVSKALEYGIPVVDLEQFWDYIETLS